MRHLRSAFLLAAVGAGLVLAWHQGLLAEVWANDTLWICSATVIVAALCFAASFRWPVYAGYGIEICPALGFLGTVVGFIMMLDSLGSDISADAWAMRGGLAIAIYTTAVGLVCALVLYGQRIALEHDRA